jgi:hypothetical protein
MSCRKQDLINASYVALEITQILYEVKWFNLHIRLLLLCNSPVLERQEHHQYQNLQSLNSISLLHNYSSVFQFSIIFLSIF